METQSNPTRSRLLGLLLVSCILLIRPYSASDAQVTDTNPSSPYHISAVKPKIDPEILKEKEEKKKRKFDTSFALQEKIIDNLKKAVNKPNPKIKYVTVPVYKTIPIYIPIEDSLNYIKANTKDTLANSYFSPVDLQKLYYDYNLANKPKKKKTFFGRLIHNIFN